MEIINIQCGNKRDLDGATLTQGLVFEEVQDLAGDKILKAFVKLNTGGVYIAITIPPGRMKPGMSSGPVFGYDCGYSTCCRPPNLWSNEELEVYLENKLEIYNLKVIENITV
jgi:hypothetical protein